jgi:hypothetical protein
MKTYHLIQTTLAAVASILFIGAATATPPNTTAANSVPYEVGQGWVTHYFDESIQTRWFRFGETLSRSYCIEAVQGSISPVQLDPNITVYTDTSASTVLSVSSIQQTNNDGGGVPLFLKGSRTCYASPLNYVWPLSSNQPSAVRMIKLNVPLASGDSGNIRLRVVDTTLFADLPGNLDTNSSCVITVTNTSTSVVRVNGQPLTWYGSTSFACGSNVATVVHDGPPGSLRGSATVTTYTQVPATGCYDPNGQGCGYNSVMTYMQAFPLRPR